VRVTVLDFGVSDVIGVHGFATPGSLPLGPGVGARREGASWRITTGGRQAVGLRLEAVGPSGPDAAPAVSLCEVAVPPATCRREHLPAEHVASVPSSAELLLRLGSSPQSADRDGVDRTVRLTIDYLGS
jgi:hypothetical protein